jgi:hypothetical protein
MKLTRLIILLAFATTVFYSQAIGQDLKMEKNKFYDGTKELRPAEVLELMKPNAEAYKEFKKARGNNGFAQVLGFAGGALIGWPIGTALGGGDPQWGLAAGGAGLILLAIPLTISYKKHAEKAIDLYNKGEGSARGVSLDIIPCGTGIKMVLKF